MSVYTERSGTFRELVQVLIPEYAPPGPTGQRRVARWIPGPLRKAKAIAGKSREFEALQVRFAETEMAFRVRGYVEMDLDHRIRHAGRDLEIIGIVTEANRPPAAAPLITITCRGRA